MTTDELVKKIIDTFVASEETQDVEEIFPQHLRLVQWYDTAEMEFFTYSVALNDETRDVRYIKVIRCRQQCTVCSMEAFEVKPTTVVRTEYRKV